MKVKCHDIETSLLEGALTRGDRRIASVLEAAWRRGARLDAWTEHFQPELWWQTFADLGIDLDFHIHRPRPVDEVLPWDHIHIKKGRDYLAKEQGRSIVQLEAMAGAVLLSHADEEQLQTAGRAIREACLEAVAEGVRTADLGGQSGTAAFTDEVIRRTKTKLDVWASL